MIGNQNVRISDQGELRLRAVGELRLRAIGEQRNVAAAKLVLPATSPSAARSTGIQKEVNSAHWSVAERWLFGRRDTTMIMALGFHAPPSSSFCFIHSF